MIPGTILAGIGTMIPGTILVALVLVALTTILAGIGQHASNICYTTALACGSSFG
jgi:hypothetical protein